MLNLYKNIIENFTKWGLSSEKLKAAIIIGSQARTESPADEYSDLDIVLIVNDTGYFLDSDEWVTHIGEYFVSFIENSLDGAKERRILFDGGLDVDFIIIPEEIKEKLAQSEALPSVLHRGYRVIIDKININDALKKLTLVDVQYKLLPTEEFSSIVNDFWYHTVWTSKKLKRGEIWAAKSCLDGYMKSKLFLLIECLEHIIHGVNYETWHQGRFFDKWAEPWIVEDMRNAYAHYDKNDIKSALLATMNLFRKVAVQISDSLNYEYPKKADDYTTNWVYNQLN